MTNQEILNYPCKFDNVEADNIKEYFHMLLYKLWDEGEGFSGKRPFGNSGWDYDIYRALAKMGVIEVTYYDRDSEDEELEIRTYDEDSANKLVFDLIAEGFK